MGFVQEPERSVQQTQRLMKAVLGRGKHEPAVCLLLNGFMITMITSTLCPYNGMRMFSAYGYCYYPDKCLNVLVE